jgi:hypothetical protein
MDSSFSRIKALPSAEGSHIPESAEIKDAVGRAVDEQSHIPPDFACNICKTLVYDPHSCNKCD